MTFGYLKLRKEKFGADDFTWDMQHFKDDDYNKEYLVPANNYMKNTLKEIEKNTLEKKCNIG